MARSSPLRLAFFACLALIAAWPLLSTASDLNTFRDAEVISHYESVAGLSVLRFHEAPLWDPYYCGGMYLLGTPQARFVSPSFLLTLLFGESRGAALTAFMMLIVGLEGTFRYARTRRASSVGALLAAPVFGLSGVFAIAPQNGWINFFGFALVPWIVLGLRQALRGELRGAVVAAAGIGWCTGFGGTYAVPLVALWCVLEVLEALLRAARSRNERRATARGASDVRGPRSANLQGGMKRTIETLIMAALVVSLGAGLAAIRLWPVLDSLSDARRVVGGSPGGSLGSLVPMLFEGAVPDGPSGQFFIGAFAVPAATFAFVRWRSRTLAVYGALWFWLAAGYGVVPSIFAATQALPVYSTLRYPERYLILFGLVSTVLCARGVTLTYALARAATSKRRVWRWVHAAIATCLLLDLIPLITQHYETASTRDLAAQPLAIDGPFHQARGNRFELAYYAPMQRGSLSCWDAYPVPESPLLKGNLDAEERLDDATAGRVVERDWSPNRIDLDVNLDRPARLRINQNWHSGWQTNVGAVESERGLLVVDLPAGAHAVALRFAPRSARGGLLVSLAALLAIGILVQFGARSPRALYAAVLLPPAAFVAVLTLNPEPKRPPKVPMAPTGEPIVDAVVDGMTRLDVRFQGGITLVAAGVTPRHARPGETIVLELDWTRESNVDAALGVFVHIEPSEGPTLNGDHVELSQTLLMDAAPANKVLRDLLPITLPMGAGGKKWKIYAGLWRVLRGGERVPVVDKGSATLDHHRVAVAAFDVANAPAPPPSRSP